MMTLNEQLFALETELDMHKEVMHSVKVKRLSDIERTIKETICEPCGAVLVRTDLELGLRNEFEIRFEIGFYNDVEKRIDFGSDANFEYTLRDGLKINHGTMGYFNKENIYQFRRIQLLNHIVTHINSIENYFATILNNITDYWELLETYYTLSGKITDVKTKIAKQKKAEIETKLTTGTQLKYKDGLNPNFKLFYTRWADKDVWYITKITPKKYYVTSPENETKAINKENIINEILNERLEIYGA